MNDVVEKIYIRKTYFLTRCFTFWNIGKKRLIYFFTYWKSMRISQNNNMIAEKEADEKEKAFPNLPNDVKNHFIS